MLNDLIDLHRWLLCKKDQLRLRKPTMLPEHCKILAYACRSIHGLIHMHDRFVMILLDLVFCNCVNLCINRKMVRCLTNLDIIPKTR